MGNEGYLVTCSADNGLTMGSIENDRVRYRIEDKEKGHKGNRGMWPPAALLFLVPPQFRLN
jgi:hypothetical protein